MPDSCPEVDVLIARCRERGLRRTAALHRLLALLARSSRPLTAGALGLHPDLAGLCNPTTLYRLLARLEGIGVVRRIGLHDRLAHYVLAEGADHHDYVVCVSCGGVEPLPIECPVHDLEHEVEDRTGFREVYHELQFYGRCPACAASPGNG